MARRPVVSSAGVLCHFPNAEVAYPYCLSTSATVALLRGILPAYPSQSLASSAIWPLPISWWLRPVSSDARVGEHIAVV
jgi:hypothetical protein